MSFLSVLAIVASLSGMIILIVLLATATLLGLGKVILPFVKEAFSLLSQLAKYNPTEIDVDIDFSDGSNEPNPPVPPKEEQTTTS